MFIGLFRGVLCGLGVMATACTGNGSVAGSPTFKATFALLRKIYPR
jgi:hypothetical protein